MTLEEVEDTFINKTDTLVFINVDGETIKAILLMEVIIKDITIIGKFYHQIKIGKK
ncbi:MAG: hypothetical protein Q606_CBAC00026G0002 [Intestinibacter bartlettii DORA_8_9]|uniref:hypothetical protein n=1 Tax=Intestinibacter bartlettii TaxID=261299 RepID=UPI0003D62383|nr:MAG: hypothetical protein Q606_CBAC00026G0002 [Intestinibacter bartlettii DORA_8_9]